LKAIFRYRDSINIKKDGPFPAKTLLSELDTPLASVKVGKLAVGCEISVHSHTKSNQVEYYPQGKAILYLEGVGEKEILPGSFMFAPNGVKHGIREVTETLTIYSVFIPALF